MVVVVYRVCWKHGPIHIVFFFSSRRRHTRSSGDWSSDVCSSDLPSREASTPRRAPLQPRWGGLDRRPVQELIAVDLETTGFDPETDRIIEIGAVRVRLTADGVEAGERLSTFVDPGRDIGTVITRLTGIRDGDLIGAPTAADAVARFAAFAGDAVFVGHNVGFDLAFLEQNGFAPGAQRLDTADLASMLLPMAPSYALQRLAADERIVPAAAHRALDDALTCAAVLATLATRARSLPAPLLAEARSYAAALGPATQRLFPHAPPDSLPNACGADGFPRPLPANPGPAATTVPT